MGNPWLARFDSSSSSCSSSSARPSSPDHNHSSSASERHFATMGTRAWTYWTSIKRERLKRKEKLFQQNGSFLLQQKISSRRTESFKIFTAKELERATKNYSESRIVGHEGYSVVYKRTLPDNRTVAIKKCKVVDARQIERFINEIDILSQINHRNVVKLLGCCLEDQVPLLVYEFISNGTLYSHIHETGRTQSISLQTRLRIAIETAEALAYLHSAASIPIVHKNVKSSNILLDDNLTAKVSDFGPSRLVFIDQTYATTLVEGNLDPEYFQTGQVTAKSDVYSFGVVLVELLTAEKPVCLSSSPTERQLARYFISAMKENRLLQVLEDQVRNEGHETQLIAIAQLAQRCLKIKGEERPTIKEVAVELQGLRGSQYHPSVNNNIEEAESLLGGAYKEGNPCITRFDSSSSSSSSTRPSSPATNHNHNSSAFERQLATMGARAGTCLTSIKRERIKRKEKLFQQNGGFLLLQEVCYPKAETFKIFTAKVLERATENYSVSRIIGQGGYGVVYKGTLPDNRTVAIKKSKIVDASQIEQFINEIDSLSQINHRNVVKLLGCCLEDQNPLLVYEFISNGTLYSHIHETGCIQSISLQNRLRIAIEIAEALAYLHSIASIQIFHGDVKSTNILLDDNLTAKVSDFGASTLVPFDQTQITTMVQGTLGYLDPEYFQTCQLTAKSDVYSFGVVLVELLTAKKAFCLNRSQKDRNLSMHFISAMKENRLLQVLEDQVRNEGHETQLIAIAQLAERCLKLKGEERPTMKEVMVELQGLRGSQYHPSVNNNIEEAEGLLGGAYNEGNPCIALFDSSSSNSSLTKPSSPVPSLINSRYLLYPLSRFWKEFFFFVFLLLGLFISNRS